MEFLHSSIGLGLAYKETVGGTKCLQKLAGTPVLLLESFRSMFGVSMQTAVGSFRLEVRSLNIFGFGCQRQCSLEKINKCAAIWNYRKEGGPSFQIQSVAESLVL